MTEELDASGGAMTGGLDAGDVADGRILSLLAIWHLPPYYHNGACETLACVLSNTTHWHAGLRPGQSDPLNSLENLEKVVAFLQALDADTAFPTNLSIELSADDFNHELRSARPDHRARGGLRHRHLRHRRGGAHGPPGRCAGRAGGRH